MLLAVDLYEDFIGIERVAISMVFSFQSSCVKSTKLDTEPAP
jgi:hypothetical protein